MTLNQCETINLSLNLFYYIQIQHDLTFLGLENKALTRRINN